MSPGGPKSFAGASLPALGLSQERGSLGASSLCVFLTGFGPFGEVKDNPSATLVQELAAALTSSWAPRVAPALDTARTHLSRSPPEVPEGSRAANEHRGPPAEGHLSATRIELRGWEVLEVCAEAATEAVPRIHSMLCDEKPKGQAFHLTAARSANSRAATQVYKEEQEGPISCVSSLPRRPLCLAVHFGFSAKSKQWKLETHGKNGTLTSNLMQHCNATSSTCRSYYFPRQRSAVQCRCCCC